MAAYLDGSGAGKGSGTAKRAVTGPALGELDMEAVTALAMASALRGELARVGNNLNQAVRLVHVHGADPGVVEQLQDAVAQVRAVVGAVHQMSTSASTSATSSGASSSTRRQAGGGATRNARASVKAAAGRATAAKPVTANPWISGDKA
ncbi:plasmid mobilization relaxosome protein MobC (plasmid) [Kineococcus sp. DHX-1]|uniref:plasmid mobilization relaxosome protein MobC n=1 Tax=Kineococcus sp. DHX-1 TaxID=3349638 RepID=UPI0036D42595